MVVILDPEEFEAILSNKPIWIKRRHEEQDRFLKWEKSASPSSKMTKTNHEDTNDTTTIVLALDPLDWQILQAIGNNTLKSDLIAKIVGVSAISVRRRYKKLKEMGLIRVISNRGARLTELGRALVDTTR